MIPIDLTGKIALVTGVGDNESFAWFIAKALNAAGAKIVLACHPRMLGIVESFLTRSQVADSRQLPYGGGELKIEKIWLNLYHGGTWPSPSDDHLYLDNIVVSRKYIGPMR